jgi:hypothetical protein
LPVVVKTPAGFGFLVIAIAALVAAVTYFLGSRSGDPGVGASGRPAAGATDEPVELDDVDLRPSYPEMNLRSAVRMPTGWTDKPGAPKLRRPGAPATPDPTTAQPGSDPTAVEAAGDDEQLPLWND